MKLTFTKPVGIILFITIPFLLQAQKLTQTWATVSNSPVSASPRSLVADASGNIYVANSGNNTVSKISATGVVTAAWVTLANNTRPFGITIDASGNIYTANNSNNTISKITPAGVVTDAWATITDGSNPYAIVTDANGNVYVANQNGFTVTKITAAGVATQAWGRLTTNVFPNAIAVDASGNVYTANGNSTISKITPAGVITQTWATLATNAYPEAIVVDASGNLYTANYNAATVSKITSSGAVTQNWATLTSNSKPQAMTIDASGNLYTCNSGLNTISKITTAGSVSTVATLATGANAYGITADGSGNIYTANVNNSTVSRISSGGSVTDPWAVLPLAASPFAVVTDASGNVYSANGSNNTISKTTAAGVVTQAWATLAGDARPVAIAIDASGNVYTANSSNSTVSKVTSSGVVTKAWATLTTGTTPYSIAVDASGNVYTGNTGTNTVSKITAAGALTQTWATLATSANPQGITVDASGNVYTGNVGLNTVSKITPAGAVTQTWGSTGYSPHSIVADASGNIYTADLNGASVSKISASGVSASPWVSLASSSIPFGITVDASGNVYTANYGDNTVSKITPAGVVTQAWATLLTGSAPYGIAADKSGNLYTANVSLSSISRIAPPQVWTGTTSTDWNTATNWNNGIAHIVPVAYDSVVIATATNQPVISNAVTANTGDLTINSGATVTVNGTLQIGGVITNNGIVTASSGTIILNGVSTQTIPAASFNNNTVRNLVINNTAGVTLGGTLKLTGVLTPQAGTFNTGGYLTLASTATGTAAVAAIDGTTNTGTLSGNVTMQQYLTAQRAYRLLGHPFNGNITLSNLQPYVDITGSGTGLTSGNASTFNYTTGVWAPYNNNTDTWNKNEALLLFVRGTPGQGIGVTNGSYTPSAPTIALTGQLNTGNLSYTVKAISSFSNGAATGWNAIGNPYPAPIDVNTIGNIAAPGGTSIYVWNATKASTGAGLASGGYDYYPLGSSVIIPAYGAFFVKNTSGTNQTIQFTESNKNLSGTPYALFGGNTTPQQGFELEIDDTANVYWDRLKISFNNNASPAFIDKDDLDKFSNINLDFYSLASDNSKLAINTRPLLQATTDSIPLGITTQSTGHFSINARNVALPPGYTIFLHDKYAAQWVKITESMHYEFAITGDTASKGNKRFEITAAPQPVISTQPALSFTVKMGPNPVINTPVTISYASPQALPTRIRVTDLSGKTIYQANAGIAQTGTTYINTANWSKGVYMIEVSNGKETITSKLIKE